MKDSHKKSIFIIRSSFKTSFATSENNEPLCNSKFTTTNEDQAARQRLKRSKRRKRAKFKLICQYHDKKEESGKEITDSHQDMNATEASFIIMNQKKLSPISEFHPVNDSVVGIGQDVAHNKSKKPSDEQGAVDTKMHLCIPPRKRGTASASIGTTTFIIIVLATSFLAISSAKSALAIYSCDRSQSKCDLKQEQKLLRHQTKSSEEQYRYINEPVLINLQHYEQKQHERHKRHFPLHSLKQTFPSISSSPSESISPPNQFISTMMMKTAMNKTQKAGSPSSTLDSIRIAAFASKLEQWYSCHRLATNELLATLSATRTLPLGEANNKPATARCQAHFDGHLCWPAAKPGQLVRLACPRLNWLSNVEQALITQQREQSQPSTRVQEQQSLKSVISFIQLPTTTTTTTSTTIQPASREEERAAESKEGENNNNPLMTASLDVISTKALAEDEGGRPISQSSSSMTGRIEGKADTRFARRQCVIGKPTAFTNEKESQQFGPYLMLKSGSQLGGTIEPPNWQAEADYSECSISSGTSEAFSRQQNSEESKAQKLVGEFDPTDKWVKLNEEPDRTLFSSLIEELERIEGAIDPYSDPDLLEQWTLCIGNIMRYQQAHHHQRQSSIATTNASGLWCPIIFDGWRCWPSTRAGDTAYVSCPSNQPGFSAERKAHKICTANGTWYRHPMTNRYWSNYTTCVDTVDLAFRRKILNLYIFGNLISLVALSASLIIFVSFKNLNCTRVTIHKNLFLSFITNNLMWLIWYTYVVNDADLLQSNPIECQFWHILLHYFLISNYFWMFCEGLYLHTLLVVAFVSEDKILKWFYMLGWVTPIPITVAYAYNRSYDEYYTNFCWMEESPYNLILMGPIVISLLLNLVFLINIVRVLVTKLRANNSPDTHQTRKAVRATLILIPLLGLHFILTPFRPEAKSEWEGIYEIFAAVCTSFQGSCVALLFCFCNGEVITVIKKKLKDTFNSNHHHPGNGDLNNHRRNTLLKLNNSNNINFIDTNTNTNTNTNNHHHNNSATISNNDSNTLRSVISSFSNGDIVVHQQQQQQQQQQMLQMQQQQPILTTASSSASKTNIKTLSSLVNQRSNRTNSSISNSSSLLTTVTASPTQTTQTISSQAMNDTNGQTKQPIYDKQDESLLATSDGQVFDDDLNRLSPHGKLGLSKSRPPNRKNSLSGSCLDKAETVHLLQGEDNHGVLTTTTSFSVLT